MAMAQHTQPTGCRNTRMPKAPRNIRELVVETSEGQRWLTFDPPVSIYGAMLAATDSGYGLPKAITGEAMRHPAIRLPDSA